MLSLVDCNAMLGWLQCYVGLAAMIYWAGCNAMLGWLQCYGGWL